MLIVESRWGYSGTSDRIRFSVDRHIYIAGKIFRIKIRNWLKFN